VTTALLRRSVAEVERFSRNASAQSAEIAADAQFCRVARPRRGAAGIEHDLLDTYRREKNKHVSVALAQGVVQGTVTEVDKMRVHLALDGGGERIFTVDDLPCRND